MEQKPPTPVAQTFLVCRETFQDVRTQQHILIGPGVEFVTQAYPWVAAAAVFVQVSSCHGLYRLEVRRQDLEGQVVWSQALDKPLEARDPLTTYTITINVRLPIPRADKYDVVLLANGEEVGRRAFRAHLSPPSVG